jgi:hypothetical protein
MQAVTLHPQNCTSHNRSDYDDGAPMKDCIVTLVPPNQWVRRGYRQDARHSPAAGCLDQDLIHQESSRLCRLSRQSDRKHFCLAESYAALGYLSYIAPAEASPVARSHALRALELDGSLAEPHARWTTSGAETRDRTRSELRGNAPMVQRKQSLRAIRLAHQRNSLAADQHGPRIPDYYTRQYDQAVKQLKFVLEMKGDIAPGASVASSELPGAKKNRRCAHRVSAVEEKLPERPVGS